MPAADFGIWEDTSLCKGGMSNLPTPSSKQYAFSKEKFEKLDRESDVGELPQAGRKSKDQRNVSSLGF